MFLTNKRVSFLVLFFCVLCLVGGAVSQSDSDSDGDSSCLASCSSSATSDNNCGPNDTACLCSRAALDDFTSCLQDSCSANDVAQGQSNVDEICGSSSSTANKKKSPPDVPTKQTLPNGSISRQNISAFTMLMGWAIALVSVF